MSAVTHEEKNEHNSVLKYPLSLLSSKPAEIVLGFLEPGSSPGVGRGGTSLARCDKPRAEAGPGSGESQQDDSGVRGTFGSGCCDACSAGEGQLGHLQDGNKIMGEKEPLCLRKANPSEIGPPKNG